MVPQLEKAGLLFTGKDETGQRMEVGIFVMISECVFFFGGWGQLLCCDDLYYSPGLKLFYSEFQIIELPTHPYYVGVQFHPEFKSRPGRPSALFLGNYSSYSFRRWSNSPR